MIINNKSDTLSPKGTTRMQHVEKKRYDDVYTRHYININYGKISTRS